jgi:hypothetical protein
MRAFVIELFNSAVSSQFTLSAITRGNREVLYIPSSVHYHHKVKKVDFVLFICSVEMRGHVARLGEKRNSYRLLVGKPEGKRPLGRPRRRWVDNIRMDLGDVGWGDVDWIGMAQDRNRW